MLQPHITYKIHVCVFLAKHHFSIFSSDAICILHKRINEIMITVRKSVMNIIIIIIMIIITIVPAASEKIREPRQNT